MIPLDSIAESNEKKEICAHAPACSTVSVQVCSSMAGLQETDSTGLGASTCMDILMYMPTMSGHIHVQYTLKMHVSHKTSRQSHSHNLATNRVFGAISVLIPGASSMDRHLVPATLTVTSIGRSNLLCMIYVCYFDLICPLIYLFDPNNQLSRYGLTRTMP